MSLFFAKNNNLIVSAANKLIILQLNSTETTEVLIPKINLPSNLSKNQQEVLRNEKAEIVTCDFSTDHKLCAITTTNKQLVVYNKDFQVLHNLIISRTASKVCFLSNGNLLVADKTGDVYLYDFEIDKSETSIILGHLSMILDVITTHDDKYVITSDRDEKIRVSHFPNSYNIVSFCLGHEEFVFSLEVCNSNVLISASGDGTIRFWNFLSGKSLSVINTNDYIEDKNLITLFLEQMVEIETKALPITGMKIFRNDNFIVIICSLYSFGKLLVFQVNEEFVVTLLQTIEIDGDLISFDVSDKLYILSTKNISCYNFYNNNFAKCNSANIDNYYDKIKDILQINCNLDNISVLYKRKYDNVQEYQEKKKLRIENKR